jgi:hypothetical protein
MVRRALSNSRWRARRKKQLRKLEQALKAQKRRKLPKVRAADQTKRHVAALAATVKGKG